MNLNTTPTRPISHRISRNRYLLASAKASHSSCRSQRANTLQVIQRINFTCPSYGVCSHEANGISIGSSIQYPVPTWAPRATVDHGERASVQRLEIVIDTRPIYHHPIPSNKTRAPEACSLVDTLPKLSTHGISLHETRNLHRLQGPPDCHLYFVI